MITIMILGNLVKDAEMTLFEKNDRGVISFTIASNKKRGEENITTFVDVKLFGGQNYLQKILPYLLKGKKIAINGELVQENWVTQEGQKRSKLVVYATNLELAGGGTPTGESNSGSGTVKKISASEAAASTATTSAATTTATQNQPQPQEQTIPNIAIDDEDLPF